MSIKHRELTREQAIARGKLMVARAIIEYAKENNLPIPFKEKKQPLVDPKQQEQKGESLND